MPPLALRKGPGAFRKWLFVGLGAATFGLYGMAFVVDRFGQHERAVPSDILVVLGARVLPGGEPSSSLRARIEKAVALYHQGLVPRLLFSGGVGVNMQRGPTGTAIPGAAVRAFPPGRVR